MPVLSAWGQMRPIQAHGFSISYMILISSLELDLNETIATHNIPWVAIGSSYVVDKITFSSLIPVLSEAMTGELNPLVISHTPTNTSHSPPGMEERSPRPDPMTADNIPTKMVAYPTRPQTASHRGANCALY